MTPVLIIFASLYKSKAFAKVFAIVLRETRSYFNTESKYFSQNFYCNNVRTSLAIPRHVACNDVMM